MKTKINQILGKLIDIKPSYIPIWVWICLPALLFWLAWYPMPLTPLLFIAFIPFFVIANHFLNQKRWKYYGALYLAFLGWNLSTTWWVYFASAVGAISMLILNSLFMLLPFVVYRIVFKRKINGDVSFSLFAIAWMLYEFGHHRWDLSWPWLCLGNGFSGMTWLVQWYEWTGTLGGTALVLFVNWMIWTAWIKKSKNRIRFVGLKLTGVIVVSLVLYFNTNIHEGTKLKVAVLQPSYDPWTEKFVMNPMEMESDMVRMSCQTLDTSVKWVLWPETSIVGDINEDHAENDPQVMSFKNDYAASRSNSRYKDPQNWYPWHTNLQLLSGANVVKFYNTDEKPTRSARLNRHAGSKWYDIYNSAMWIDSNVKPEFYHKSKLVPGTEQMPFIATFPFLESLALSLDENSTTGSLGVSKQAKALGKGQKVAPVICYESIYGDYVRGYIKDGTTWIGIITNDAWWNQTPGYQQHFSYAKLRAIEERKWIARSANTGTSGFIDSRGNSHKTTDWYEKICVSRNIYCNLRKTLYFYLGDLGVLLIISLLMLVSSVANSKRRASSR